MKSITKMMLVAMVLVAALVVAPAAARAPGANSTIFVGEEDLNVSALNGGAAFTRLVHYSGAVGEAIDDEIPVKAISGVFTIDEVKKGIKTGNYYVDGNTSAYLNVRVPQATVDVVLDDATRKDSVVGKSVTRTTPIAFKFANNLIANLNSTGTGDVTMNIEVTLPGGGVVTTFGGPANNLKDVPANGTTSYLPISLQSAEAGNYVVQAKWPNTADFYGKGFDSTAVTFAVLSKSLAITSDKDSIVRGNSFTVTVAGESKYTYYVFIKDANIASDLYPFIVDGQNGVTSLTSTIIGSSGVQANVTTVAGGTRSVQFGTNTSTKDQTFIIRVQDSDPTKNSTYDEVKVKVEKGGVTITSSGTGVYYIGEEVTLSGTCTDNKTKVHLFMTGPNLASADGVNLLTLNPVSDTGAAGTSPFNTADVEADDTWSFKWSTGDIATQGGALDAGGYTIYAVSKPVDKSGLSGAQYATASVQLRSGFITATSSGAVVAKGDDLTLTGTAQGDPNAVKVWIFGKNKQMTDQSATVEDDGSFEYELQGARTGDLAAGQYFVVIQHPMMNKILDVDAGTGADAGWIVGTTESGFRKVKISGLQASDAATALITALDSPNIDDTYVKLTFVVEEANIFIDAIGDKAAGSTFTITGTTNLAVGDTLNIQVTSAAFQPTTKTEASGFGSVAGVTTVQQGDGANTWSFEVDGASFKPDQYIVNVESIETDTTATAIFNVIEATATTQPTGSVTATPTGTETTPTGTATTAAAPTQSPGFGALIALAGLGAVAFLVLRRN